MSGDGRYIAFQSEASNLAPGDINGWDDIIIKAVPPTSVDSVNPHILPTGNTTSVTVTGRYFMPDATTAIDGLPLSNLVIVDENTLTVDITVPQGAPEESRDVLVRIPGTGPGLLDGSEGYCIDCVTLNPPGC